MTTYRYRITETASYEIDVEIEDDLDPNSDEAKQVAEEEFTGLADMNDFFVEVSERDIELAKLSPKLDAASKFDRS